MWTVCLRLLPDSVVAVIWTQALLRLSPARQPLGYRATTKHHYHHTNKSTAPISITTKHWCTPQVNRKTSAQTSHLQLLPMNGILISSVNSEGFTSVPIIQTDRHRKVRCVAIGSIYMMHAMGLTSQIELYSSYQFDKMCEQHTLPRRSSASSRLFSAPVPTVGNCVWTTVIRPPVGLCQTNQNFKIMDKHDVKTKDP